MSSFDQFMIWDWGVYFVAAGTGILLWLITGIGFYWYSRYTEQIDPWEVALYYFAVALWYAEHEPGTPVPEWCFLRWPMRKSILNGKGPHKMGYAAWSDHWAKAVYYLRHYSLERLANGGLKSSPKQE